jgi:hypothetical protein
MGACFDQPVKLPPELRKEKGQTSIPSDNDQMLLPSSGHIYRSDQKEGFMGSVSWFTTPVIGDIAPEQAIPRLRAIGEFEVAAQLERALQTSRGDRRTERRWPFKNQPWQHTSHVFGYIRPDLSGTDPQPLQAIEAIQPERQLQDARITITLNRLHIAHYPGGGIHRILVHFAAHHQQAKRTEMLHFNATYRVREGESAGIQGYPIFVGLHVGAGGIILKCRTINVLNEQDEAFVHILESDTFKAGLRLTTAVQPVIAPFSEMALGLVSAIATKHRNESIQDFDLGLGFDTLALGGRLAEGTYLAVQVPEDQWHTWDWGEWVYLPARGRVAQRQAPHQSIPYNYLAFGVSRYKA